MTKHSLSFFRFRPQTASEQDYQDTIDLLEAYYVELRPDDPVPARSAVHKRLETREDYKFTVPYLYLVRNENAEAIGFGNLYMTHDSAPDYEDRKHHTYLHMFLLPELRGQGIGRHIFQFLIDVCVEKGITLVEGDSYFPSGQGFADHIGATTGLIVVEVKVYLKDIDWQMMEAWVKAGQERNPDTKVIYFRGLYSDDDEELNRFAELETAIRADIPDGELEGLTQIVTAEKLREEMAYEAKQGIISDYMLVVEADGGLTGFTRINYQADSGYKIEQRETGVLTHERGRGLGKWLKAAMLLHIRETYPDVQYLHTGSANVNAPMRGINERIGFEEFRRLKLYTMSMETVQNYLQSGA